MHTPHHRSPTAADADNLQRLSLPINSTTQPPCPLPSSSSCLSLGNLKTPAVGFFGGSLSSIAFNTEVLQKIHATADQMKMAKIIDPLPTPSFSRSFFLLLFVLFFWPLQSQVLVCRCVRWTLQCSHHADANYLLCPNRSRLSPRSALFPMQFSWR